MNGTRKPARLFPLRNASFSSSNDDEQPLYVV
jgi:hypothetical protein